VRLLAEHRGLLTRLYAAEHRAGVARPWRDG
jgi:hypothetical protein